MKRFVCALALLGCTAFASADNWPAWRGPTGQGFCEEKNVLLKWSDKENVKWKIPLADQGNSTPVVWGDRIFVTQANKGGSVRSLLCFARADGMLKWQKDISYSEKERNWSDSWARQRGRDELLAGNLQRRRLHPDLQAPMVHRQAALMLIHSLSRDRRGSAVVCERLDGVIVFSPAVIGAGIAFFQAAMAARH